MRTTGCPQKSIFLLSQAVAPVKMVGIEKPRTPPKTSGFGHSTAYNNFSVVPGTTEILPFKVGCPQIKVKSVT